MLHAAGAQGRPPCSGPPAAAHHAHQPSTTGRHAWGHSQPAAPPGRRLRQSRRRLLAPVLAQPQQQQDPPQRATPPPGGRIEPRYGPPPPGGPPLDPRYNYDPRIVQPPPYAQQQQQQQQGYYPSQAELQAADRRTSSFINAIIAAAFVAGLGLGVYFDSEVNISPNNVSSTEFIDRNTPNPEVCMANGYSASVFDMKLYVTFNPFNVYTAQPVIKSGCVLRRANVGVLEREKLVTQREVDMCKSRMNTFAYMGDLKNGADVACVYHSEEAENEYLEKIRSGGGIAGMAGSMMGVQGVGAVEGAAAGAGAPVKGGG